MRARSGTTTAGGFEGSEASDGMARVVGGQFGLSDALSLHLDDAQNRSDGDGARPADAVGPASEA